MRWAVGEATRFPRKTKTICNDVKAKRKQRSIWPLAGEWTTKNKTSKQDSNSQAQTVRTRRAVAKCLKINIFYSTKVLDEHPLYKDMRVDASEDVPVCACVCLKRLYKIWVPIHTVSWYSEQVNQTSTLECRWDGYRICFTGQLKSRDATWRRTECPQQRTFRTPTNSRRTFCNADDHLQTRFKSETPRQAISGA